MTKKIPGVKADTSNTSPAGADESGAASSAPLPSPIPLAGEGTGGVCPHRGKGGSFVVDDATQTRNPIQ